MRHWAAVKIQKMLRWKLVISQTLNPKPQNPNPSNP